MNKSYPYPNAIIKLLSPNISVRFFIQLSLVPLVNENKKDLPFP